MLEGLNITNQYIPIPETNNFLKLQIQTTNICLSLKHDNACRLRSTNQYLPIPEASKCLYTTNINEQYVPIPDPSKCL